MGRMLGDYDMSGIMNKTAQLVSMVQACCPELEAIYRVRCYSLRWGRMPPWQTNTQGSVVRTIIAKITLKRIIQMRNRGIRTDLGGLNEYEINLGGMNSIYEGSLPLGLAVRSHKLQLFNHLLEDRLILLRGGGTFTIPISNSRLKFLKGTVEISYQEKEMILGYVTNTVLNLLPYASVPCVLICRTVGEGETEFVCSVLGGALPWRSVRNG